MISRYIKDHIENTKITIKMAAIQCKETTVPIENTINFFFKQKVIIHQLIQKNLILRFLVKTFLGIKHFDADILVVNKCLLIRFD